MKFAQIGVGSMGKRRIRNLMSLRIQPAQIVGFDLSPERLQEAAKLFGIRVYPDFQELIKKENPDAYIISSPPDQHAHYFLQAARAQKHFFVEISTTDDGYDELLELVKTRSFVAAPSCTYRFYEPIQKIRKVLQEGTLGNIFFFTQHTGQYLPDWHPYEDYRTFYGPKKHGAMFALVVFQIQWLSWIIDTVFTNGRMDQYKLSDLQLHGADLTVITVHNKNSVGTIILDLLAKPAVRVLKLIGTEGTLTWDWQERELKVYTARNTREQTIPLRHEQPHLGYLADEAMYEREIGAFLHAIKGNKPFPYTFYDDYQNLVFIGSIKRKKLRSLRRHVQ